MYKGTKLTQLKFWFGLSHTHRRSRLTPKLTSFAYLYALIPRVIIFRVTGLSTLIEPSTTASTTTVFARFVGDTFTTSGERRGSLFCRLRQITMSVQVAPQFGHTGLAAWCA